MVEITDILDVEKYIDDVDAVIFDLDDTLYSEKEYVRSGYRAVEAYFEIDGLADEMWTVFEKHGKPIDEVLDSHDLIDRKDEALHVYRFHKPDIHLYPGVREMLQRIRLKKKIGIITDGRPEGQRAKLDSLGLNDIEFIITDELGDIEYRKPNPEAYILLADRLNVRLGKMVYIGDNKAKDFTAPKKLGMYSLYFNNHDGIYGVNSK